MPRIVQILLKKKHISRMMLKGEPVKPFIYILHLVLNLTILIKTAFSVMISFIVLILLQKF